MPSHTETGRAALQSVARDGAHIHQTWHGCSEQSVTHLVDHLLGLEDTCVGRGLKTVERVRSDHLMRFVGLLYPRSDAPFASGVCRVRRDLEAFVLDRLSLWRRGSATAEKLA